MVFILLYYILAPLSQERHLDEKQEKNPTSLALCRGRECCLSPTGDARGRGVSHPKLRCPIPGDADLLPEILQQHPSAVVVTYTSTPYCYHAGMEVHVIFFPHLAGPRSWDTIAIGGRQAEHFPSRWLMPRT